MTIAELFILSVGLSLDAFVISICEGLSLKKATWKNMCFVGLLCGAAQGLMPIVGYFLGRTFFEVIHKFNCWIEFSILAGIGIDMIVKGVVFEKRECNADCMATDISRSKMRREHSRMYHVHSRSRMYLLAIVDSFDVLAVSVIFPELNISLPLAMTVIGITTFVIAALGVKIGSIFGGKYRSKAEFCGGIILIIIGTHLLLKGLGLFPG